MTIKYTGMKHHKVILSEVGPVSLKISSLLT